MASAMCLFKWIKVDKQDYLKKRQAISKILYIPDKMCIFLKMWRNPRKLTLWIACSEQRLTHVHVWTHPKSAQAAVGKGGKIFSKGASHFGKSIGIFKKYFVYFIFHYFMLNIHKYLVETQVHETRNAPSNGVFSHCAQAAVLKNLFGALFKPLLPN